MALTDSRRRRRDPEGRMALREHLLELRKRLLRSAMAVVAGAVGGWFLYEPLYKAAVRPVLELQKTRGVAAANVNFPDPVGAFNLQVQSAITIGVVVSSPIWLYQLWAFITPGLTRRERRTSLAFVGAAVPLFLAGVGLAWLVLPKAVQFLNEFVPEGSASLINAPAYVSFVLRVVLAFGIAFVIPVVLVSLNVVGILPGRVLVRQWRIIVFLCFLFAAVVTPSPEATSMCALGGSMCVLFAIAVAICLLNDRRRARRSGRADLEALPDDEASPL